MVSLTLPKANSNIIIQLLRIIYELYIAHFWVQCTFSPAICFIKWKNNANWHAQSEALEFYFKFIGICEHDSFRDESCPELG